MSINFQDFVIIEAYIKPIKSTHPVKRGSMNGLNYLSVYLAFDLQLIEI